MPNLKDRLIHAYNAFINNEEPKKFNPNLGMGYYYRPDKPRRPMKNERSIITAIYNRIAVDCASVPIVHARVDENRTFKESIDSGLNNCLSISANLDQTGRALIQDIVMSMCDEGVIAVVPVDTNINPRFTNSFDILSLRVGKIVEWYPEDIKVLLYNEKKGKKEEVILSKKHCAIIENPFYSVMNEPNSTVQRLIRKLSILDAIDEQAGSGKLDLIVQLPYVIKTEARRQQAEIRRKDIEMQLSGSKYGIAYTDGTERITQLNRSVDNQIMSQIEYLTSMLYSQLGMPKEIFDGTANEEVRLSYQRGTIEPILSAIADEFVRKFLTKTARTQGQSIIFVQDPFKLVPMSQLPDMADKFTRNEILSSNEFRAIIGRKPSDNPEADELRNKNLNKPVETQQAPEEYYDEEEEYYEDEPEGY